jgi:hypothetical protein
MSFKQVEIQFRGQRYEARIHRVSIWQIARGTNDVRSFKMDGLSKQLTVAIKNGNYRRVADVTRC